MTLTFGSLFAGIGGFDLGLERAGMVCKWQVEIDPFCQKVLAKHWPDVERFSDVRKCGKHNLPAVDLVCGGFPCQPHSVAGKRRGAEDDRNLWPEYRRVVAELRPRWMVGENVPGIRTTMLDEVLLDLGSLDYATTVLDLPAVAFDAPHRRHRYFIVAHTEQFRCHSEFRTEKREQPKGRGQACCKSATLDNDLAHADKQGLSLRQCQRRMDSRTNKGYQGQNATVRGWWSFEPDVGRVANGVPNRVDRLRALGNAVVPQVAEWIGQRIIEADEAWQRERMEQEERQQLRYDYNADFVEAMK